VCIDTVLSTVLRRPLDSTQYLSIRYTERLAEAGAITSVGSRGDSYDNALAETIIGLYKMELIRKRGPWKNLDDVEFATLEWVDWFNHRRLLETIGHIPPAELEDMYVRGEVSAEEAGLKQVSLQQSRGGSKMEILGIDEHRLGLGREKSGKNGINAPGRPSRSSHAIQWRQATPESLPQP